MSAAAPLTTQAVGCKTCAARQASWQNNKYQDESEPLTRFYADSPPQHSFFCTIQHLMNPILLWENVKHSSNSMSQIEHAGETRKYTGLFLFLWMNGGIFLMMAQVILAMIPSFRDDDANDPVFFALGGSLVVVIITWALMTLFLQKNQDAKKGPCEEGSGWNYDFGCAWKILDKDQECSEVSLAVGKKLANDRVMRYFMCCRIMWHCVFIACKAYQGVAKELGMKVPFVGPSNLIALTAMAWVMSENVAAVMGYGPQCPSYKCALFLLSRAKGGPEKMPFRPCDKGIYRFQSLLVTGLLSPCYLVVIGHLIMGVKTTSTWSVPFCGAVCGLASMTGTAILKSWAITLIYGNNVAGMMSRNADNDLNQPVVAVLGPEYGARAGTKIHVKTIQYSLTGPVVSFPGTFGCAWSHELVESGGDVVIEENELAVKLEEPNVHGVGVLQTTA